MEEQLAKLQSLIVCDRVKQDTETGRYTAIGVWQRLRVHLPFRARLSFLAVFTGDLRPETMSVSLWGLDPLEQLNRDVGPVPLDPAGKSLRVWASRSDEFTFGDAGRYMLKIDADGISPASYEFELVSIEEDRQT